MKKRIFIGATIFSSLFLSQISQAQNDIAAGAQALQALTGDLEAYLDPVTTVVYIIAAILGIIGAIRVYSGWQAGKDNAWAAASLWIGACLFLLIANTLLRAFFV
jgi:CBS domain containing-hemolysin-like protein